MIYVFLAIFSSSIVFVLFKFFDKYHISNIQALTVNYLVAALFGYFSVEEALTFQVVFAKPWFALSIISGVLLILTFFVYAVSVQKVGMAITSVSGKMSVVIPVLFGFMMFHEEITWLRIAGIIVAMAAFYLTLKRPAHQKFRAILLILPLLLFVGNGFNDSIFKIAQEMYIGNDIKVFLTTAFFISLVVGIIILSGSIIAGKQKFHYKNIIGGVALGTLNWYSTYFFLICISRFDISVFVPVFNVCIVCIAALIGYFFFSEKLSRVNIIGIALAIISIILIAGIS